MGYYSHKDSRTLEIRTLIKMRRSEHSSQSVAEENLSVPIISASNSGDLIDTDSVEKPFASKSVCEKRMDGWIVLLLVVR